MEFLRHQRSLRRLFLGGFRFTAEPARVSDPIMIEEKRCEEKEEA